jgi:hypothetical protein
MALQSRPFGLKKAASATSSSTVEPDRPSCWIPASTNAINHKGSLLFRPGTIEVFVGPQLETAGLSDDQVGDLARRMQRMIGEYVTTGTLDPSG